MTHSYRLLDPNHYLSTQVGLVKECRGQDVVGSSQLVDFIAIEGERDRRKANGFVMPSYTAFIIDSITRTLREHPKLNRIVYRGLTGYRWVQFERIDMTVGVEVLEGDLDMAYASIIRDVDQIGLEGVTDALQRLASTPANNLQLKRLQRFPTFLTAFWARATGRHPQLWVRLRGSSCAITSPAKYGIENVVVKSCWPLQFAFGRVKEHPMVVEGCCLPRRSAMLSLSWHRELTTGAVAARFFEQIVQRLEQRSATMLKSHSMSA